jgi:hypothetical protein
MNRNSKRTARLNPMTTSDPLSKQLVEFVLSHIDWTVVLQVIGLVAILVSSFTTTHIDADHRRLH